MKELIEQQSVLFHNRARMILLQFSSDFRISVAHLDRQWDENVFQLQHSKYQNRLQHQLMAVANELITNAQDSSSRSILNGVLNDLVVYYLGEFRQKTGAM
jgi:hypothetical protein